VFVAGTPSVFQGVAVAPSLACPSAAARKRSGAATVNAMAIGNAAFFSSLDMMFPLQRHIPNMPDYRQAPGG
jgi:hypothetical protein